MTHKTLAGAALALIAAAGTAQADSLFCPGFGDVDIRITFDPEGQGADVAQAEFLLGLDNPSDPEPPILLTPEPVDTGYLYRGEDLLLRGQGDLVDLTAGDITVHCEREDVGAGEATLDAGGGLNIPAVSLGGNLRAGPGTEFADIGGLTEGTPIILLANTGVDFDGYPWWEIVLEDGSTAFQWGGILCVPGGGVPGAFEGC